MKYFFTILFGLVLFQITRASDWDEFKVKRENNFEFMNKPVVIKKENAFQINFETKSFCDVQIAIEEKGTGKIIRHLAYGVLGKNAPQPFQANSKKQSVMFDGKDDAGKYIVDVGAVVVRVSLGLTPKYEKSLFDEPKRRHSRGRLLFVTGQNGVYVYDGGNAIDFVKKYDFDGNYKKTIYPFPANKIKDVKGLNFKDLPSKKGQYPEKVNYLQTSFLNTGSNYALKGVRPTIYGSKNYGMHGKAASILAVGKKNVAIGMGQLARLDTEGGSNNLNFYGPEIGHPIKNKLGVVALVPPRSAAFSPNDKKLYLTGYHYGIYGRASGDIVTSKGWKSLNMVYELDYAGNAKPAIFMGNPLKSGSDNKSFNLPSSVTTDDQGNVYVADYLNNRVQVYSSSKKFLKSIAVKKPAYITVLPKSKEVCVVSYVITVSKAVKKFKTVLTKLGKFPHLKAAKPIALPKEYNTSSGGYLYSGSGFPLSVLLTDQSGPLRLWASKEMAVSNVMTRKRKSKARINVKIWELKGGKFELINDFEKSVIKALVKSKPAYYSRSRIQYNPVDHHLYSTKTIFGFNGKSFKQLYKINVASGNVSIVDIPFDAEDFCFDIKGYLYLKSVNTVARYDPKTMKEVPWDYGVEIKTATSSSSDRKLGSVISGIKLPSDGNWHTGGIFVNAKGDLVVSAPNGKGGFKNVNYPGRARNQKTVNLVHIFDKHGKLVKSDIVQGVRENYGIGIDNDQNVYMMNAAHQILDGKSYPNTLTGTIVKFLAKGGRSIKKGNRNVDIPLNPLDAPKRPLDLDGQWVEGAQWYYGGVGFSGKNSRKGLLSGTGCACWNARMAFDYFNRTFAPELERFRVAVLDSSGNLITNIGRFGNRDTAGEKGSVKVGGDGVTLMHGAYLAVNSGKQLFIADPGNDRIVVVKLGYANSEAVALPSSK